MKLEMLNQAGLNGFNSLNGAIDIRLFPAMRGDSTSFNSLNGAIDIRLFPAMRGDSTSFNSLNGAIDIYIL